MMLFSCAVVTAFARDAAAQAVPGTVAFTGRLSDTNGPLTGAVNMRFRLFDAAAGGTAVWDEDHPNASATDGLLHVTLGETTPFDAVVFDGGALYLDVAINGTSLLPRAEIHSVPYAVRAGVATTAERLGNFAPADVQQRVTTDCGPNASISAILPDGTATCVSDNDSGGDITGITTIPGSGITGGTTSGTATLGYDATVIQSRVNTGCTGADQSIKTIDQNGTVTCETDDDAGGDITGVTAGTGLSGGGATGTVTVTVDSAIVARKDAAAGNQSFDTNLLHLNYTSNLVGINTSAPATALDVNGTTTSDGYLYGLAQTGYRMLTPSMFTVGSGGSPVDLGGSYWELDDAGGGYTLYAAVTLPTGATLTGFQCWYIDANTANNATFSFNLVRHDPDAENGTALLAAALSDTTTGASGTALILSTTSINTPVVDNLNFGYYAVATVIGTNVTLDMDQIQFRGCRIQYTYTSLSQ
jgi:hypothetical protein